MWDMPIVSVVSAFFLSIDIDHCHDTSNGTGICLHHEYLVSVSANPKISLYCRYSDTGTLQYCSVSQGLYSCIY